MTRAGNRHVPKVRFCIVIRLQAGWGKGRYRRSGPEVSYRRGDPDENCFTLTRTGIGGTMAAVFFGVKKEIPVHTCGAGDAKVELRRS